MLKINEIFYSIQGESSKSGFPCIFIRLSYCNLRCSYCDTKYAYNEGVEKTIDSIISEISVFNCRLVEITGGEPLFQPESLELMKHLCDLGYKVMLETSGSLSIENIDKRVKIIMDIKCPSSSMVKSNFFQNINFIKPIDEIKFVIGNREDFLWSKSIIEKYRLIQKNVLISPVLGQIEPSTLVSWILEELPEVRFQLQLHKYIWDPLLRGV